MTTEWTNPHKPKYDHGHLRVLEKGLEHNIVRWV